MRKLSKNEARNAKVLWPHYLLTRPREVEVLLPGAQNVAVQERLPSQLRRQCQRGQKCNEDCYWNSAKVTCTNCAVHVRHEGDKQARAAEASRWISAPGMSAHKLWLHAVVQEHA